MNSNKSEIATLAAGCFWCIEAVIEQLQGVQHVESGYIGGDVPNPSYQLVCTGTTGHAEAVQVTFDPDVLSYRDLLRVFFAVHDPTTLNRQGPDVGTQYRSEIFAHTDEQEDAALEVIAEINAAGVWDRRIVTEVSPAAVFYPAEDYHREYYRRNGSQPYCQVVISPKVAKFRKQFQDRLKTGAEVRD